ncbi:FO synthase subunit 1 [Haloarcula vallismortis]|uniref:7,8-didemethyl-8-hydroxy-5-deazariboflavin synthase n=2 Tax=Haloarcula vallismortis TaxID=28442 RepID=M0IVH5_HALVA|nr:7,8-didemethyl-8-hydroxy-5-deazariboflavin synthase subunit CofG [Haloarcula vallismortis]EMA00852.1 FO synthase subunit 1 [Haloarcula vallismortis ATCC 29715]SDW07697.1 FO synthase subunit 1 [Haloarcula vallismortis]
MISGTDAYDIAIDISDDDVERLLSVMPEDVESASALSYCRNVFLPLTTACRYTCTYCTYYDPPGQAELMDREEIRETCRRGAEAGCTEALFTFGDDPDERYTAVHDQLAEWGHDSIHEYLREACEIALEEGLLPHANPGDQTREQMAHVADLNASMGVMLETTTEVQAHGGPRSKNPGQRLNTLRVAGELGVPFTTGILVGIGEDWHHRAESLLAIREMHERYGHIQEVIVQPVVKNERWQGDSPDLATMRRVTAMARAALPEAVSVQVPPNLAPARDLTDCGIDDLGGVSPVTVDHINPEYEWPALQELTAVAEAAEVPLTERLPVYDRFVGDGWLSKPIEAAIGADTDAGERFRSILDRGVNPVAR